MKVVECVSVHDDLPLFFKYLAVYTAVYTGVFQLTYQALDKNRQQGATGRFGGQNRKSVRPPTLLLRVKGVWCLVRMGRVTDPIGFFLFAPTNNIFLLK